MRYLIASIICFAIALAALLIMGCAKEYQPFPEGDTRNPPVGYIIFCHENPDSIFCKEADE